MSMVRRWPPVAGLIQVKFYHIDILALEVISVHSREPLAAS